MDVTVFNELKDFKIKLFKSHEEKLSEFSSWAIWDEDITNTEIIEKKIDKLNGRVIFVALNFSGERTKNWKIWNNFHCGEGDKNLRDLLSVPEYEGAYITDLIKNRPESKSEELMKELTDEEINYNFNIFFQEIEMLKSENIKMYLFGRGVEILFKKYLKKQENHEKIVNLKQKVIKCQAIYHYSKRYPNSVKIAQYQLNIHGHGDTQKPKIFWPPLWPFSQSFFIISISLFIFRIPYFLVMSLINNLTLLLNFS